MEKFKNKILTICLVALLFGIFSCGSFAYAQENNVHSYLNSYAEVHSTQKQRATDSDGYLSIGGYHIDFKYYNLTTQKGRVETVYQIQEDLPTQVINNINVSIDNEFVNANRLYTATTYFNCHSYAWYSQSTSNNLWINDPTNIIIDNGYIEMAYPHVGDRICYFDNSGVNLHSGIVTNVLGNQTNGVCGLSNTVQVISKWGASGVYEHRGDECPYTSSFGGGAVSVKFYHLHDFSSEVACSAGKHSKVCNSCGISVESFHIGSFVNISTTMHTGTCTVCGFSGSEGHSWQKLRVNFKCAVCPAVSKYIEVDYPDIPNSLKCQLINLSLRNNEYISLNNLMLLYSDGRYYLLFDDNELIASKDGSVVDYNQLEYLIAHRI